LETAPWPSRWGTGNVLYFALTREGAVMEMAAFAEMIPIGYVVAEFDVRLSHVLDITDKDVVAELGIRVDALLRSDPEYPRSVAEAARVARCEGLLVPSRHRVEHKLLVVFDPIGMGSEVVLVRQRPLTEEDWSGAK
jgi:RES domain-containing protein